MSNNGHQIMPEKSSMPGLARSGLKGVHLHALTEGEVERIHNSALQILAQTGIIIHDEYALALLDEAGCRVNYESQHVYLPAQVIEDAVEKAPAVVKLYNRLGLRRAHRRGFHRWPWPAGRSVLHCRRHRGRFWTLSSFSPLKDSLIGFMKLIE
jgi:trimethylamine:corrinoid methyltransferase-like protein